MKTLKRQREPSTDPVSSFSDDADDENSDIENKPPSAPKRATKKLRTSKAKDREESGDGFSELKALLVSSEEAREKNQKEMVNVLRESTQAYERASKEYLNVFTKLVAEKN